MSLQAGIVGLPNVGKSTLFNALTSARAEAANYPFATIEPNVGVVPVPDGRLAEINSVIDTKEVIPAVVEILDIAGLVRGASQGEGLGNQFLGHIRSVDAIVEVVRCFDDPDVTHVEGSVDPVRDIETIETELMLADLQTMQRRLERLERAAKSGEKQLIDERDLARQVSATLDDGVPIREVEWSRQAQEKLRTFELLTAKPILYVCNVDESGLTGNEFVKAVQERASRTGAGVVVISAEAEAEIAELDAEDRAHFLEDLGLVEPGLESLARAAYAALGLRTFFTAGPKEIRAWTIRAGSTAPQAAGVIHTDFQAGFIRAEVYRIDDLVEAGSEAALKAAGKMRVEGKDYVVEDGDVLHFRFNV